MYEIIRNVITSKRYELSDMLKKIDTLWIQGDITDNQRTELVELARENALPENSYSIQNQIDTLFQNYAELASTVRANTDAITVLQGGIIETPTEEEYPQYVQPTGSYDSYNSEDKVTYNGKHYICQIDNCVWNPGDYPAGWKEVE